jgi:hypothetical protein
MSLRRYVATGRGQPFAIAAVLGAALVGGVAIGVIEGEIDDWFSLLVIFPLLIGLAAGGGAAWMVSRFQLRAPVLAAALAIIGAAAGYVGSHFVDYRQFRAGIQAEVGRGDPTVSDDEIAKAPDEVLVHETGSSGFRGYLDLAARQGVRIKRMSSSDDGTTFTGVAAWVVWVLELLLAAGTAAYLAFTRAREPFCEPCETWYGSARPIASGGNGTKDSRKTLVAALEAGDAASAAAVLAVPPGPKASFFLEASTCPRCSTDAHCTLKHVRRKGSKTSVSTLEAWVMTSAELTGLSSAVERAAHGQQR